MYERLIPLGQAGVQDYTDVGGSAIRGLYGRLRAAGRPAKLALTACMRKLLTILNAMLRDQKAWEANA